MVFVTHQIYIYIYNFKPWFNDVTGYICDAFVQTVAALIYITNQVFRLYNTCTSIFFMASNLPTLLINQALDNILWAIKSKHMHYSAGMNADPPKWILYKHMLRWYGSTIESWSFCITPPISFWLLWTKDTIFLSAGVAGNSNLQTLSPHYSFHKIIHFSSLNPHIYMETCGENVLCRLESVLKFVVKNSMSCAETGKLLTNRDTTIVTDALIKDTTIIFTV